MGLFSRKKRGVEPQVPAAVEGASWPGLTGWSLPAPTTVVPATPTTVAGVPAFAMGINKIADAVATATMHAYDGRGQRLREDPNIIARPNSVWTYYAFLHLMVSQALIHGGFVALPVFDPETGDISQLAPVPAANANARMHEGMIVWDIGGRTYRDVDVFSLVRGTGPNQPMPIGAVASFRQMLGGSIETMNQATQVHGQGVPAGGTVTLTDKNKITKDQAALVKEEWIEFGKGPGPRILPSNMAYTPPSLAFSAVDRQFLESQVWDVAQIAMALGIDAMDISSAAAGGGGNSITYTNWSARAVQFVATPGVNGMLQMVEQTFSDMLPDDTTARCDRQALLSSDPKNEAEVRQIQIANKTVTSEELRARDGLPPIKEEKPPAPAVPPVLDPFRSPEPSTNGDHAPVPEMN